MDRRGFLLTSLAGALAGPTAAGARQAGKIPRIAVLAGNEHDCTEFLRRGALGLTMPPSLLLRADQIIE